MKRLLCFAVAFAVVPWLPGLARGEVVDVSTAGFLVRDTALVRVAPATVYESIKRVGSWWDPDHTWSGDSRNLSLNAEPGGCFCERLPGGGGVRHMTVVFAAPGKTLRLAGALGPLQQSGLAGSMTWSLSPAAGGTAIEMTYSVGGYFRGGFQEIAPIVDEVLGGQFRRLQSYVETGKPTAR
jgi:hypothetical protein